MNQESKVALITGITGQDGSHLADLLLAKGYSVHGTVRRKAVPSRGRLSEYAAENVQLHEADLADQASIEDLLLFISPDEVYNLAAQSHVGTSFSQPWLTYDVTGLGAVRVFEAVRRQCENARVYQASSSEMFGQTLTLEPGLSALSESSTFAPVSPYGVAKVAAHMAARYYRRAYGMFVSSGILFNHEGPRRGENFVTRKITRAVARFKHGVRQPSLSLGNMGAVRDWGWAPEYVEGMWRMLQRDSPGEFVLATGEGHTVWEFLERAWEVTRLDRQLLRDLVLSVPSEYRPSDIERLVGNPAHAKSAMGWEARVGFNELVSRMVANDLLEAEAEGA